MNEWWLLECAHYGKKDRSLGSLSREEPRAKCQVCNEMRRVVKPAESGPAE